MYGKSARLGCDRAESPKTPLRPCPPTGPGSRALSTDPRDSPRRSWTILALAAGLCLVAGGVYLVLAGALDRDALLATAEEAWSALQRLPAPLFFVAMALLCLLPIPISPFYIAAATLFGVGLSIAWTAPALALNQFLAHALTTSFVRPYLAQALERRGMHVPRPSRAQDQNLLIVLVRVGPGIPYSFQNYVLGLAGVDRTRSVLLSVPIQMVYAIGWIWLGRSAFEGRFGLVLGALGAIIAISIGAKWLHTRLQSDRQRKENG